MTKKELKEAIYKLCNRIDESSQDSEEYKRALKELKEFQSELLSNEKKKTLSIRP